MKKEKRGSSETHRLIAKLSKRDIMSLSRMTCKEHRHSYLVHPNCAFKDGVIIKEKSGKGREVYRLKEKIGFLDIETFTFQFNADQGIILCYVLKELNGKMIKNSITPDELKKAGKADYRLLKDLCKDLQSYTRIIGHNVIYFDFPMARSRAVCHGLDFPLYKSIYVSDTLKIMWRKFKLKYNSLKMACKFFGIPAKQTKFDFVEWLKAVQGDVRSLKKILKHCTEDVISTEALWKKINAYAFESKRSI